MQLDARPTVRFAAALFLTALGACGGGGQRPSSRDAARDAEPRGPAYLWYAGGGLAAFSLEQTQFSHDDEPAYFVVPDTSTPHNCHDLAFDRQGNLWTVPVSGDRVLRIPVNAIKDHEPVSPDLVLTSPALDGAQSLVFDPSGNLWVLSYAGAGQGVAAIARFDDPGRLSGNQIVKPSATIAPGLAPDATTPFEQSTAIAFDGAGNLWLAALGGVSRFDRVAALTGDVRAAPAAVISTGDAYASLAFDANGSLWITAARDGYLALRIDRPGVLTGVVHPTPAARVRLERGTSHFAGGMAVDHEDALWIALSDRIVRVRHATSLTGELAVTPDVTLGNPLFPDLASKIILRR